MVEFRTPEGTVEVHPVPDGSSWIVGDHRLTRLDDVRWSVEGEGRPTRIAHAIRVDDDVWLHVDGRVHRLSLIEPGARSGGAEGGCTAPMPGAVLEVLVSVGDEVEAGTPLVVMEAMKMEHRVMAPTDGTVVAVHVEVGGRVLQGQTLVDVETDVS
jgi:3-methylcrotonyl-CoA carboxylase alpha subunit